jgi:hypothetical protein
MTSIGSGLSGQTVSTASGTHFFAAARTDEIFLLGWFLRRPTCRDWNWYHDHQAGVLSMKAITEYPHTGWHFSRRTFEMVYRNNGRVLRRVSAEYLQVIEKLPEGRRQEELGRLLMI